MAFKLRSGNKPAFKNIGSSPAMQKSKNKPKKQEDFTPAYPGADYSKEQIAKMTEAEKIAKIDGYEPKKDREKSKELGKKEKNFNFKRPKAPGKQKMTLEERRAKHIADNKFRTAAAVDQHKENMRKKQLKSYKDRGTVFIDKKTGKTIAMQKTKLIKPLPKKQPKILMEGITKPKMTYDVKPPQSKKKNKKKTYITSPR